MENKIRAGIAGGAGYTGGELIRVLLNHPSVRVAFVHSTSNAGNPLHMVHHDLLDETELTFSKTIENDIDVLFLCLGHGEAKKFLSEHSIDDRVKVIDLSQDFRLGETSGNKKFVYGLPELNREAIKSANNIANPGCFATAITLGLLPLAKAGILNDIYTTGITGSTGAGQGLSATSHFSWRANNIQAYKSLSHQHLAEIGAAIKQSGAANADISFIPWRGDFARGIFVSSQLKCELSAEEIHSLYSDYYKVHPFTSVSKNEVSLKQVINTNKCMIQLEQVGNKLVVHTVIDNLLKGASGQAVQNMNLMFGVEEGAGLKLKAVAF